MLGPTVTMRCIITKLRSVYPLLIPIRNRIWDWWCWLQQIFWSTLLGSLEGLRASSSGPHGKNLCLFVCFLIIYLNVFKNSHKQTNKQKKSYASFKNQLCVSPTNLFYQHLPQPPATGSQHLSQLSDIPSDEVTQYSFWNKKYGRQHCTV